MSKVLKMRTEEKIILLDNTEHEYIAEFTMVSKSRCEAKILEKNKKPDISSKTAVHLFVPPLKNQNRWELILEKGTEIGVASFTPLITERTEVKELRKLDRLQRIVQEAAEQSGRTKLPIIHPPVKFLEQLSLRAQRGNLESTTANLIAALSPEAKPLQSYNLPRSSEARTVVSGGGAKEETTTYNLFLGPVGDFTEKELQLAIEHKFYPVTLGSQILRTETAAIVASSLILSP